MVLTALLPLFSVPGGASGSWPSSDAPPFGVAQHPPRCASADRPTPGVAGRFGQQPGHPRGVWQTSALGLGSKPAPRPWNCDGVMVTLEAGLADVERVSRSCQVEKIKMLSIVVWRCHRMILSPPKCVDYFRLHPGLWLWLLASNQLQPPTSLPQNFSCVRLIHCKIYCNPLEWAHRNRGTHAALKGTTA